MVNIYLEIERLKVSLRAKGIDEEFVDAIAAKADADISMAIRERLDLSLIHI